MKIKTKVKLEWQDWNFDECLNLIVKFKYPNKIFLVTLKEKMFSSWDIDTSLTKLDKNKPFKTRRQFDETVVEFLSNRRLIENRVYFMILDYHKKKAKLNETDLVKKQIHSLIDGYGKDIEIEVEIKDEQ